uniref:Thrombomodulin n=1 Tax=Labrus bergylta TaxID=56723 RepID=A0A3Q3N3C5_9LABR
THTHTLTLTFDHYVGVFTLLKGSRIILRHSEIIHSQRGHCAGKTCHAVFQEPRDFKGARSRCKEPSGELFVYSSASEVILNSIVGGISGQYWLEVHGTSERAEEAGLKNCSSISVVVGRKLEVLLEPCQKRLDGFLCQSAAYFQTPSMCEEGVCVDSTICMKCEHRCENYRGVYQCVCLPGYKVSATDPTKCEQHCTERACLAKCITNDGKIQCSCPLGYISDTVNGTAYCTDINECENKRHCDHTCSNSFGGYKCSCDPGYELYKEYKCVKQKEKGDDESGSTSLYPTPESAQPAVVPSYIKTGSVLSITVFVVLLAVLLCFLVRNMLKRCGKFQLSSFKHHDIDIFYLQQVTTETYKRLSFD